MHHLLSFPPLLFLLLVLVLFILFYIHRARLYRLAGEIGRQRCLLSRYLSLLDWLADVDGGGGFDRLMSVYARENGASVDCQFVSLTITESRIHRQEPPPPSQDHPTTQSDSQPEPAVHVPTDSQRQQHRLRPSLLLRVIPSSSSSSDDGGLIVMAAIDTGALTSLISAPLAGRLLSMTPPTSAVRLLNAPVPIQRFRGYSRTFLYQSLAGVRLAQCLSRQQQPHQHVHRPYITDEVRLIIDGAWREATFFEPYAHHQFVHDELAELLESPTSSAAAADANGHHRAWTDHAQLAFDDGRVHMIIGQDLINRHLFRPGMSVYQLTPWLAGLCTPMGVAVMGVLDRTTLGTYLRLLHRQRLLICGSPSFTTGISLSSINEQQQQQQAQLNRLLTVQCRVSFWRLLTVTMPGAILVANGLAALAVVTCLASVVVGACQAAATVTDQLRAATSRRLRTFSDRLLLTLMEWAMRCDVHYRRHVHLPLGHLTDLSSSSVRFVRPMDQVRLMQTPYTILATRVGGRSSSSSHPKQKDAGANNNNDPRGALTVLRAMLDTGAPSSFITARLVSQLALEPQPGDPAPPGAINDGSHLPKVSLPLFALNFRSATIKRTFTFRVLPEISSAAVSSCSDPFAVSSQTPPPPGVSNRLADAVDSVLGIKLLDREPLTATRRSIEVILGADALASMILPSVPFASPAPCQQLLFKKAPPPPAADHLSVHMCGSDNVSILVTRFAAVLQGHQCPAEDVAAGKGSYHYYSDFNKSDWTATGPSRLAGRAALAHGATAAVFLFVDYLLLRLAVFPVWDVYYR